MQVFRRGAYRDLSITVAELESEQAKKSSDRGTEGKSPAAIGALGVGVVDLTDVQRRELKVKGGVRVESVEGAAARANVREGDVILAVDNVEITSAKQFEGVVAKIDKTKAVNVLLRRGEWVTYVVIRPVR